MRLEGRGGQTRRAACGGCISVRILVRGHLPNFICRGCAACATARAFQNEPRHRPVACFFFAKTQTGGWLRGSGAAHAHRLHGPSQETEAAGFAGLRLAG